jgi:hypothetical protein
MELYEKWKGSVELLRSETEEMVKSIDASLITFTTSLQSMNTIEEALYITQILRSIKQVIYIIKVDSKDDVYM